MFLENIIAGPIKNLTDARYFAARGVQAVFFDIRPESSDYIPEYEAIAIKEWIDVDQLGFVMPGNNVVEDLLMAENLKLNFVVWTNESATTQTASESKIMKYWKGNINDLNTAKTKELLNSFDHLIIESPNQSALDIIVSDQNLLDTCYLMAENILNDKTAIVKWVNDGGKICLTGGEEEKVGLKSFDELDDIIDLLEEM